MNRLDLEINKVEKELKSIDIEWLEKRKPLTEILSFYRRMKNIGSEEINNHDRYSIDLQRKINEMSK